MARAAKKAEDLRPGHDGGVARERGAKFRTDVRSLKRGDREGRLKLVRKYVGELSGKEEPRGADVGTADLDE